MRDIIFLYLTSGGFIQNNQKTIVGNVLMRVYQVVENLKLYYPELNVYCYSIFEFMDNDTYKNHSKDDCILILNKGCFQSLNQIIDLYKLGYQMVSDYIDNDPKLMNYCIAHISSSVPQHGYLSTNCTQPVYHVIHGFDNHFDRSTYELEQPDELKMTYCGAADNLHLTLHYDLHTDVTWIDSCTWWKREYYTDNWQEELPKEEMIKMIKRQGGQWVSHISKYLQPQTHDWKDQLKYYNCHIGLRKYDEYAPHKPFTKGFTASALRSPIVVDSFNIDARYYLPSDYPLFSPIDGAVDTTDKINDVLNYVKDVYNTPEWDYAVQCMDDLYHKCNPKKIAKRWKTVFQKIEQLL